MQHCKNLLQQIRQNSKESTASSDSDSSSDDESMPNVPVGGTTEDKVQQAKETEAGAEISALVNYVQPVHFSSFESAESNGF
jgi:phosphatidylinositol phospholipase C beta